jgi:RNA polymerase sigma factor (sigma-70 family)
VLSRRTDDERLARAATRGDERAFAAIHQRYHQPLYAYCRSILRHDEDALDALQATLTAAWSALGQDRRMAPLRPWLYRIAHNESISVLRRRARQSVADIKHVDELVSPSAAEDAGRREQWELLMADLADLPERARSALVLRELSGLAPAEIAVALGTTVGAAKQSILEARRALAEMAEGRAMTCESVQARVSGGDRRVLHGRRVAAHLRDCPICEEFAA